jgi:hypothetical protein
VRPAPVQTNIVPDAPPVPTGAAQPAGVPAEAPTTTGDTVSTTVRFVIVAPPTFATTIVYVTGAPTAPPPAIDFVTVKSTAGAGRTNPVEGLLPADAAAHAPAPTANAVFDTPVSTHTVPTVPVIVNVNAWPIPRLALAVLQMNNVPPATELTTGVG